MPLRSTRARHAGARARRRRGRASGPSIRRGVAELNGEGEAVGGIVIMRYGENALDVIDARQGAGSPRSERALPAGVEIVPTYDRSELIRASIDDADARR